MIKATMPMATPKPIIRLPLGWSFIDVREVTVVLSVNVAVLAVVKFTAIV